MVYISFFDIFADYEDLHYILYDFFYQFIKEITKTYIYTYYTTISINQSGKMFWHKKENVQFIIEGYMYPIDDDDHVAMTEEEVSQLKNGLNDFVEKGLKISSFKHDIDDHGKVFITIECCRVSMSLLGNSITKRLTFTTDDGVKIDA
jgi:hypothetical protein